MQKFCLNCMRQLGEGVHFCPECGFDSQSYCAAPHHLKPGTLLNGRYQIGRVLGEGGFGITYVGRDNVLDLKVAVKEFYMSGFVSRDHTRSDTVQSTNGSFEQDFIHNRRRFLDEAKVLARLSGEPGIVMVRDFFEANNTAYIVMEFLSGYTLKDYLARNGKLRWESTWRLMKPVLESLRRVHAQGIIHRDISPDNIMLTKNGSVKLLDFGAARKFSGDGQHSLSVIMKLGYAPVEQYSKRGIQGPWTDVYALCATMYRCMTGEVPEEPAERMNGAEIRPPYELGCCQKHISDVIMKGLAFRQTERWQSVDELIAALEQENVLRDSSPVREPPKPEADPEATVYAGAAKQTAPAAQKPPAGPKPKTPTATQETQPVRPAAGNKPVGQTPAKQPSGPVPPKAPPAAADHIASSGAGNSYGHAATDADAAVQAASRKAPGSVFPPVEDYAPNKAPSETGKKQSVGSSSSGAPKKPEPRSVRPAAESAKPNPAAPVKDGGKKQAGWKIAGYILLCIGMAVFAKYWVDVSKAYLLDVNLVFVDPKYLSLGADADFWLFVSGLLTTILAMTALTLVVGMLFLFLHTLRPTMKDSRKTQKCLWWMACLSMLVTGIALVVLKERGYTRDTYDSTLLLFPVSCMMAVLIQAGVGPAVSRKKRVITQLLALLIAGWSVASIGYWPYFMETPLAVLVLMPLGELIGKLRENRQPAPEATSGGEKYWYYTCPHCGQKFRIPTGKGKVKVTCPGCKRQFETAT